MQRGRLLILIGLLLLLATVALVVVLFGQGIFNPGGGEPTPPAVEGQTQVAPVEVTQIVIAVQPLPRGQPIPAEALGLAPWPVEARPTTAITDTALVIGKLARYDIERGEPVLTTLISDGPDGLSSIGSDAALRIPPGQVALAVPLNRLSGVGYALQEGDHLNVLVSLLFADLEEATQTITPSTASLFTNVTADPLTGATTFALQPIGVEGQVKFSEGEGGLTIPFFVQPSEEQRPRLVVQQIVQDAVVLGVGNFQELADNEPTPTPLPEGTAPPPPTPVPPPDIITLIVSPQDAVVLTYFLDSKARFTFALRAAGDTTRVDTESVTLQYTIERFRISVPTQLPYGVQPAVRDVNPPVLPNDNPPVIIPLPDGTFVCLGTGCP
ncbi:MAG: Flp pilus assembly protein CpaB [Chloroflexi bacterium]|nr:Flp pilus assembly protein CpaB [Chloroflexota bacterium]